MEGRTLTGSVQINHIQPVQTRSVNHDSMVVIIQVNIIPKWVNFTIDVRCKRQEFRQEVIALAQARVEAVCLKRGVNCTITRTHDAVPVSLQRLVLRLLLLIGSCKSWEAPQPLQLGLTQNLLS